VRGERTQRREKDPGTIRCGVAAIAQRFVAGGVAHRHELPAGLTSWCRRANHRLLGREGELAHPRDRCATVSDVGITRGAGRFDALADPGRVEYGEGTAGALDRGEGVPGLGGQFGGQRLHVPRAAGGVEDSAQ